MIDLGRNMHSPTLAHLIVPLYRHSKIQDCIETDEINVSLFLLDDLVEILSDAYSISIY